ncbi:MAG: hypothetical protein V5A47_12815 [Bacteroidales bacterium]
MILKKRMKAIIVVMVLLFGAHSVMSCSVPVFQYAMERWNQSFYDGVLLYKGSLSQEEKETFAEFQEMLSKDNSVLNLRIEKLDVESNPDQYEQLLQDNKPGKLPALALWYPREKGSNKPFWTGPLHMPVLETMMESAKFRELTNHLLEGSPVVWMLVQPAGQTDNNETVVRLKEGISKTVTEMKQNPRFEDLLKSEEGEVSFPVVEVSADNAGEAVLLSMITGLKEGSGINEPLVIPVFGRGRALTTVSGKDISQESIYNIMRFLMSPCACQVKMASPGTDLLVKANWEKAFNEYSDQQSSPTLTSVMPDSASASGSTITTTENDSIIDLTTDQNASFFSSKIMNTTGSIIGILVVIIGVVTVIVLKRR